MTNQIATISAEINTLEAEGFALAKEWKSICKADKSRFTKSTKADGFDTRLGKLMFAQRYDVTLCHYDNSFASKIQPPIKQAKQPTATMPIPGTPSAIARAENTLTKALVAIRNIAIIVSMIFTP